MAYNVAANMQPVNFIGNMLAARQQEIGNSLAQREMGMREQNALMQRQQFDAQNQQRQAAQKEQEQAAMREWVINGAKHLASAKSEQEFAMLADRYASDPRTQQLGITRDQITPDGVSQILMAVGGAPVERQVPFEQSEAYLMEQLKASNARRLEMLKQRGDSAPKPVKQEVITRPVENGMLQDFAYDPANPEARTPVGTPYKKEVAASPKDINTAKQKIIQLQLARKQLTNIKENFNQGTWSQGGFGQGYLPTVAGKKFDAAVDAIRTTIGAITRVPGIGAMSDYETRLAQAPMPGRKDYEDVTTQKLQQIDDLITAMERGYGDFLGGGEIPSGNGVSGIGVGETVNVGGVKVTRTK